MITAWNVAIAFFAFIGFGSCCFGLLIFILAIREKEQLPQTNRRTP